VKRGAPFTFVVFTSNKLLFNATPLTPDPRKVGGALTGPDADEWTAAMDTEIGNLRDLHVLRTVARPIAKNVITPKRVFHRKFENGELVNHKARLVARGFMQVLGIDCNEAHLYAPVMRLKSLRSLVNPHSIRPRSPPIPCTYIVIFTGKFTWTRPRVMETETPFGSY